MLLCEDQREVTLYLIFESTSLSDLETHWLGSEFLWPLSFLHPTPQFWGYSHSQPCLPFVSVLGIWTQFLLLSQQTLLSIEPPPQPLHADQTWIWGVLTLPFMSGDIILSFLMVQPIPEFGKAVSSDINQKFFFFLLSFYIYFGYMEYFACMPTYVPHKCSRKAQVFRSPGIWDLEL